VLTALSGADHQCSCWPGHLLPLVCHYPTGSGTQYSGALEWRSSHATRCVHQPLAVFEDVCGAAARRDARTDASRPGSPKVPSRPTCCARGNPPRSSPRRWPLGARTLIHGGEPTGGAVAGAGSVMREKLNFTNLLPKTLDTRTHTHTHTP
jgi:hypothetical protein